MKWSTKVKMVVASIRSLSAKEAKELVISKFKQTHKEFSDSEVTAQKMLSQIFAVAHHGSDGCIAVAEATDVQEIGKAKEAVASLAENTCRFLEENEDAALILLKFVNNFLHDASKEAQTFIKSDESLQ